MRHNTGGSLIDILKQCQRELKDFPGDVREDLADTLARLQEGHSLSLPLSRPMPSIGRGVHELRFRDRSGVYRVIYYLAGAGSIWLLYAFQKKTQKTSSHDIEVAQKRLREVL
jgi:phage-related protein